MLVVVFNIANKPPQYGKILMDMINVTSYYSGERAVSAYQNFLSVSGQYPSF